MKVDLGSDGPVAALETAKRIWADPGCTIRHSGAFCVQWAKTIRQSIFALSHGTDRTLATPDPLIFAADSNASRMDYPSLSFDRACARNGPQKTLSVLFELSGIHRAWRWLAGLGSLLFLSPLRDGAKGLEISEPARFRLRHSPANVVRQVLPCNPFLHW